MFQIVCVTSQRHPENKTKTDLIITNFESRDHFINLKTLD